MLVFKECANYRGPPQVKLEKGQFFWRVDCDGGTEEPWLSIPEYLGGARIRYYTEEAKERERVYTLHPNRG